MSFNRFLFSGKSTIIRIDELPCVNTSRKQPPPMGNDNTNIFLLVGRWNYTYMFPNLEIGHLRNEVFLLLRPEVISFFFFHM